MNGNEPVLAVYLGKKIIADLSLHENQLIWRYSSTWQAEGFPVSPHLPLTNEILSINVNRYLRNLFPEGDVFDELIQSVHVSRSNTFALIRALGLDTSGALVFRQPDAGLPDEGFFRFLSETELTERLDKRSTTGLIIWDGKPRLSVAGIQDKINLLVNSQGQMGFGDGMLCSTHILKFEKQSQTHLIANEYVTMRLARECGLNVPEVTIKQYGNHMALLVERFDRKLINDTEVKRKHVIDGCQAFNLPPENKYERNLGSGRDVAHIREGVSLPMLFDFANQCKNPALTKQQMLDWLLFNVLVYNSDAHGKNISFYVDSWGISLAPFYDLVNISLYPELEQDFAMALGDDFDSKHVNAWQIAAFAESCKLSRKFVAMRLEQIIGKMLKVLPMEIEAINNQSGYKTFFSDYQRIVTSRCKHLLDQCQEIQAIPL